MKTAVIQLNTQADKPTNVARAIELTQRTANEGAQLVVLPETLVFCGPIDEQAKHAESIPGPTIDKLATLACDKRIYISW